MQDVADTESGQTESPSKTNDSSSDGGERSKIWQLFTRLNASEVKCQCPLLHGAPCGVTFSYRNGGPTSTLWRHVRRNHPALSIKLRGDQPSLEAVLKQASLANRLAPKKDRESGDRLFALWIHKNLRLQDRRR